MTRFTKPAVRRRGCRGGFTLIETAICTALIGIGICAMLQLLAAGTVANDNSTELTTAVNLAANVHEGMATKTFAQTYAYRNVEYSPPVDARLDATKSITALGSTWKQRVNVDYVDPNNIGGPSAGSGVTDTLRVTVTILHNDDPVHSTSWVVSRVP